MSNGLYTEETVEQLREKRAKLVAEISCSQRKMAGISNAIEARRKTLVRIDAQLALGEPGRFQPAQI
jgi:hypothetical protein